MAKSKMRDMIILLPGITGSVLQKDGKDVWALSGAAVFDALTSLAGSLQQMRVDHDDPEQDDLGDGVRATRLMPFVHLIPGLVKIDGYSLISQTIRDNFYVTRGDFDQDQKPANFFEFPYDWRRDNRAAARKLQKLIAARLPLWRDHSGAADAKAILIAHSMGGLVARHYLEVLEGWRDCRALITFGTPFRGSVDAVNYLSNGYKKLFVDLTELMRTFPSVYQLLPIYPMLDIGGNYHRIAEIAGLPGITRDMARDALQFHRDIEAAVTRHQADGAYRMTYIPVVGTRQPTLQSAVLEDGKITALQQLPDGIDPSMGDGDGTVPRISAIPLEMSNEYRDTFLVEQHGMLHSQAGSLADLVDRLKQMQTDISNIRGAMKQPEGMQQAAISLSVDDFYLADEHVTIRVELIHAVAEITSLGAKIQPVGSAAPGTVRQFTQVGDRWILTIEDLPAGLYSIEVETQYAGPNSPRPVHSFFGIVAP